MRETVAGCSLCELAPEPVPEIATEEEEKEVEGFSSEEAVWMKWGNDTRLASSRECYGNIRVVTGGAVQTATQRSV